MRILKRGAWEAAMQIEWSYNQQERTLKRKLKWNDIFTDEAEIIENLLKIYVPTQQEINKYFNPFALPYTGYEYIHGIAKQLQNGKYLTEKQITMAKKSAKQIKKALAMQDYWE